MKLPSVALLFTYGVLCCAPGGYAKESLDTREDHVDLASAEDVLGDDLNNGSLRARGLKKKEWSYKGKKGDDMTSSSSKGECGVDYCEAKQISLGGMKTCLKEHFDHLSNLYFPDDGDDYYLARITASGASRYPAAIVYVENVEEVQHALKCAVDNGYKVSARGGNHSYQGMATMDGYVVIDMGRTCKPDEFVVDKTDQGPHILEGSKYIGTIKAQAGCTNAIMLAAGHEHFGEDAGMTLIGSCPSVGITGFVLGGGGGDISPYVGYGVDIVKEFELVLYDGTVVKASEEENADLYWASRGGGGGNGIVTHLTYKIVQAPKQKYEEDKGRKFTLFYLFMDIKDIGKAAKRIMEWFYDADPLITGKFGGGFGWGGPVDISFNFIYLGSWREAVEDLKTTGLLDDEIFTVFPGSPDLSSTILSENYEVLCNFGKPCPQLEGSLSSAYEFNSYAEAEIFHICKGGLFRDWSWTASSYSGDFCKDLGIDDEECEDAVEWKGFPVRTPKVCNKVVIDAMMEKAGDPSSFMNSHGPSQEFIDHLLSLPTTPENTTVSMALDYLVSKNSLPGASILPRLDDKLFTKILKDYPERLDHLQHAAALKVDPDATAYPWRNGAFMLGYSSSESAKSYMELLLKEGYPLQGYYAYLNPQGMKKWRSFFFDDKWKDLAKIRAKYDPKDVFGKPLTIESLGE
ncbi:hypothetical protein CTEN210_06462 [Chaetoceros tenuissimus]|uniref:FAD-binding PCMH-type domain-containing protein n=1 Tax=Chaetoceros tenuissimus TaxID=426638 RepID=A0AAD3CRR4_9STRA|nr:hypothetical protein CTEN210_06462 [Chaetoceros tenuissimus]